MSHTCIWSQHMISCYNHELIMSHHVHIPSLHVRYDCSCDVSTSLAKIYCWQGYLYVLGQILLADRESWLIQAHVHMCTCLRTWRPHLLYLFWPEITADLHLFCDWFMSKLQLHPVGRGLGDGSWSWSWHECLLHPSGSAGVDQSQGAFSRDMMSFYFRPEGTPAAGERSGA